MEGKKLTPKQTKEYKKLWIEALQKCNALDYIARRYLETQAELDSTIPVIKWRHYVDKWMEDEEFVKEIKIIKHEIKMTVENELYKKVYSGDFQAIKFYLERLYKEKYSEKIEIDSKVEHSGAINIIINKPNGTN